MCIQCLHAVDMDIPCCSDHGVSPLSPVSRQTKQILSATTEAERDIALNLDLLNTRQ